MPRVLPADFPNDATLRMSALNVFRMLIPAFRSAGASGAVISEYRSGTGLTDLYLALANTSSRSPRAIQGEPAPTG